MARKEWTKSEEKYMETWYTLRPVQEIANKLDRSVFSVKGKATRMGLNHHTDVLSAKIIAKCFDVNVNVVIRWIEKFNLPCRKIKLETQTKYAITNEGFWLWAEKNKDIINWSRYELMSIAPEPEWVEGLVKSQIKYKRKRYKYTDEEIVRIKNMLHRGYSYRQIADEIGRSYYGINHLCRKIYQQKG